MKKTIILILLIYLINDVYGQIPASSDDNWILNSAKSDEFNSTTFNSTLWTKKHYSGWGENNVRNTNVLLDGNNLKLMLEERSPGVFYTGQIESSIDDYLYGYYETYCKVLDPGYYKNGIPYTSGLVSTFWTYYVEHDASGCRTVHDEIDILEPKATPTENAHYHKVGVHTNDPTCVHDHLQMGTYTLSNIPALFEDWHKYAVEFLPDKIIYYFDDEPFFYDYNSSTFPTNDMKVVFALAVHPGVLDVGTTFPQYQLIDYFRFYELNFDCTNPGVIENQSQLNTFEYAVKSNITIGTSGSNISVSSGEKLTFRMNNNCTIEGNFTVNTGSELSIIPTQCY